MFHVFKLKSINMTIVYRVPLFFSEKKSKLKSRYIWHRYMPKSNSGNKPLPVSNCMMASEWIMAAALSYGKRCVSIQCFMLFSCRTLVYYFIYQFVKHDNVRGKWSMKIINSSSQLFQGHFIFNMYVGLDRHINRYHQMTTDIMSILINRGRSWDLKSV